MLLFSSVTFKSQDTNKEYFFLVFFAYFFVNIHLQYSSRIKDFSYFFCLMKEESGSVSQTNGHTDIKIWFGTLFLRKKLTRIWKLLRTKNTLKNLSGKENI
jgi:hypothetical protein